MVSCVAVSIVSSVKIVQGNWSKDVTCFVTLILTGAGSDWEEHIVATHPPLLFTGSPAFVLYMTETSSPVSVICSCITLVF